jgi:hypothetical protein
MLGLFVLPTPVSADVNCNTYTYTRDDDSAYAANLPFSLKLGQTEYENVYITTNATLTFGQPDGAFGDYPQTPSVSVAGYDWVTFGDGAYVSFGSTENTLCVEWSLRPYPRSTGDLTQIRLLINKYPNGTWHGEVTTFGWLPDNLRRGIRYEQGAPVVTIEGAFDVGNGGVPVEVEPAPTPSSFTEPPVVPTPVPIQTPDPEPTASIEPTLSPEPTPTPEPSQSSSPIPEPTPVPTQTLEPTPEPTATETIEPIPTPTVLEPMPTSTPEPTYPQPLEPEPTPEVTTTPIPEILIPPETPTPETTPEIVPPTSAEETAAVVEQALADGVLTADERAIVADALLTEFAGEPITFEALQASGLDYADLPPETPITLENGVVLTAAVADALQIFESGTEILATLFKDPAKAFKALANIGADMTPESRQTSQGVVVATVIVGQIAQVRKIG